MVVCAVHQPFAGCSALEGAGLGVCGAGFAPLAPGGGLPTSAVADCLAMLAPCGDDVPERVLTLFANVLEAIVDSTERLQQGHEAGASLTVFHGLRAPPISIEAYLVRIAKYAKCSPACFAHAMVHVLKLAATDAAFAPTRLNVHRLVLTGVLISAKFLDDRYFNNAYYAKIGGVSTVELNRLELEMLQLLDFQLSVTPEQLVAVLLDAQSGRLVAQMAAAYTSCVAAAIAPVALAAAPAAAAMAMLGHPGLVACGGWDAQAVVAAQQAQAQFMQQLAAQRKRRSNSIELMDYEACRPRAFARASLEVAAMAQ